MLYPLSYEGGPCAICCANYANGPHLGVLRLAGRCREDSGRVLALGVRDGRPVAVAGRAGSQFLGGFSRLGGLRQGGLGPHLLGQLVLAEPSAHVGAGAVVIGDERCDRHVDLVVIALNSTLSCRSVRHRPFHILDFLSALLDSESLRRGASSANLSSDSGKIRRAFERLLLALSSLSVRVLRTRVSAPTRC